MNKRAIRRKMKAQARAEKARIDANLAKPAEQRHKERAEREAETRATLREMGIRIEVYDPKSVRPIPRYRKQPKGSRPIPGTGRRK